MLTNTRRNFLRKFSWGSLIFGIGGGTSLASNYNRFDNFQNLKNKVWDPYDFGAKGDGKTIDTKAIQTAIDNCYFNGGGKVVLNSGTFVSGTIILKSNVCLHIEAGATLLGSKNINDYPDITPSLLYLYTNRFTRYLIYAEKAENISVTGRGTIDGRGRKFPYIRGEDKNRPYIIRFSECNNITIRDITFLDSARWLQHYLACNNVSIDSITVISRTRENRDGIDVDSCDKVCISNSYIDSGDDAIVLKSTAMSPCRNIIVSNCVLRSKASALKLGTESNGGFENILFTGCTIFNTEGDAIALEMVDGGKFERITVSNIIIQNARSAIFVRLGNRAQSIPGLEKPGKGSMSNIIIDNIQASGISNTGCSITGLPDQIIKNISLSNIQIQFEGEGTIEDAKRSIPEKPEAYPSSKIYGTLPVYGFFCRHIQNLRFFNIDIEFKKDDIRPVLYCENVSKSTIVDFNANISPKADTYFVFKNTEDVMIRGCRPSGSSKSFLHIIDNTSKNISLFNNDFSQVQQEVVVTDLDTNVIIKENINKKGNL
ncbi:MAG: glycosyl hydrolase family 28 protein [Petrimonas sp.]|jgi:hypothetical protein|nr:glycosyl hydrolase family 28 protein [Petrimonas sp.]